MRYSDKIFFLTSGAEDVRKIGEFLETKNPSIYEESMGLILGYQLSYPDEKILKCTPEECTHIRQEGLYAGFLMVNKKKEGNHAGTDHWDVLTPGISDESFIRGKVPMTKEEIRELAICKLHLQSGSVLYDIGSGTGSIAVETGLLPGMGDVYAIEQNPEGVELIRKNAAKFGAADVHVVQGLAPDVLLQHPELPAPTHAFIGGTKGNFTEILKVLRNRNPQIRIVVTAITLETIRDIQDALDNFNAVDVDVAAVSVSKSEKLGAYHLMKAQNMVYIFSFCFSGKTEPA